MFTSTSAPPPPQAAPAARVDMLYLALLCVALFGLGLGFAPLANPDEARYAEIPREMLAQHDFVTPRLDGVKYFEKPPLTYWLVAGSLQLFGPGEAAARLTPAIFATLGVLLTYGAMRSIGGREAAMWAAIVQASALLYFAHARILITDMVVSVLISAALSCFLLGVRTPAGARRRWLFLGLYASAAGATLAKGLIGFLLPGAVIFLWLLLFNQWHRLRPFHLGSGLLLFAAIAVPWHVLVARRNPDWAWFYFVHEHWLRFTTVTHGRNQPWWFFLPVVLLGLFPWSGFLGPALRASWLPGASREARAEAAFPLVWAGFILLFFSASHSKLVPYALPVFPPLAWLIGRDLAGRLAGGDVRALRVGAFGFVALAGLLGIALLVVSFRPGLLGELENLAALQRFALLAGLCLVGGAAGAAVAYRLGRPRVLMRMLLGSLAAFGAVLILAAPAIARASTKDLARIVAKEVDADDIVLHYHDFFHDFTYYSGRLVGTVAHTGELELSLADPARRSGPFVDDQEFRALWNGPRQVYLVLRRSELSGLMSQPGFRARVLAETSRHLLLVNRL